MAGANDEVNFILKALEAQLEASADRTPDEPIGSFNWELAEAELTRSRNANGVSEGSPSARSPKNEIYGRSLSTLDRLGASMPGKTLAEVLDSPEAAQTKAEFLTSVYEGFGTDAELGEALEVREFDERSVVDGLVMSRDLKTAISFMTEAGLLCAMEKLRNDIAKGDQRFFPQLVRSVWDHKLALLVDRMARGETDYNTIMVASPFVEEAAAESGDAYWQNIGYVPKRRRGFVQLYHVTGGKVVTGSLSFDGSDKEKLREVFGRYGVQIPKGEITDNWLRYRITRNLSADEAKALATELADMAGSSECKKNTNTVDATKQYETLTDRVFSESYIHIGDSLAKGYQTTGMRALIRQLLNNAHDLSERYAAALHAMWANEHQFADDNAVVLHEILVYATIEMMRALHLETEALQAREPLLPAQLTLANALSFQNMLGSFSADGARNGRVYSACGLEIGLGSKKTKGGPQSAYGGVDGEVAENSAEGAACDYLHTGCYCCPYNSDGSNRDSPMKVVARREANGTAYCKRPGCGAWLSADGKTGYIGTIARRAQRRKAGGYALAA